MAEDYVVLDIETCPIDLEGYFELSDEEQKKLLNPIDSRVVAIGIRRQGSDIIIREDDEKLMLEKFWGTLRAMQSLSMQIIGFNITHFDLPFLVTRSFIHNVKIVPFSLKSVVDLREKVNAYRYGPSRGTLKDFGKALGIEGDGTDGSDVAKLCWNKDWARLENYLKGDLAITDGMLRRMKETSILGISKW